LFVVIYINIVEENISSVLDFTNYNTHTCISSSVTPKSADNYKAVYIGVGAFVVTALVAVIVFATLG
jgi:flagellar biosynthesis/type III secretory pathway M-ring protein FliF/YscJ